MTPKSLLRLPAATSTVAELAEGSFQRVIDDPALPAGRDQVTNLVLCSGKVYYDIAMHEERQNAEHTAVARVEMLYPFPEEELMKLMDSYPNLEQVVWVQEEPRNMGGRAFMRRRMAAILPEHLSYDYVGRQLRAAPGEGYAAAHKREQARIVRVALGLEKDRLERDSSAQRPVM
jgi:2-oxoglutarate dehydrogenase E1 component